VQCRVILLGGFGVAVDRREIPAAAWRHRRALELVKILSLARGRRLAGDQVIELLWPDLSPAAGAANLRKAAHLARGVLGPPEAVVLADGAVSLFPHADVAVDAEEFEQAADAARRDGDDAAWGRAVALYSGDLLPDDAYAPWAQEPRERLRLKFLAGLRHLRMWDRLVEEDPLDEEAQRELVRLWWGRGNRHAALRAFARLRDVLARELGVPPSPETMTLWKEIQAVRPASPAPALPMVGRDREADVVLAAWDDARRGRGGAVLVSGEAGIGKSRLCEEVVRAARADGAVVLVGAAQPEEASSPFAVVLDAVDGALGDHPAWGASPARRAWVRASRSVGADGASREVDGLAWSEVTTPGVERQRMFSSVARAVTAAATERALLLAVDDLHHADDGSLQLLTYLARIAPHHRVLLVLSHRTEELVTPLAALRATLLENARTRDVRLDRLPREAVAELVARTSGGRASPSAVEAIWELGEGNPFYSQELAAAVAADGTVQVPDRLYEVVRARLDRLDPVVRSALERMAVAGDRFSVDELVAVLGVDDETAFRYLDDAALAGVVDEHAAGYRFRHTLLRRALERSVPWHHRRRIHAQTADRLARIGSDPARVAYHLLHAGEKAAAVPWLERAARQAAALGAYGDALRLATDAATRAGARDDARLLALRADLLYVTGDPGAVVAYDLAIATAPAETRPRLIVMKARALLATGDVEGAGRAVEVAEPVSEEDRISALVVRGLVSWANGAVDDAEQAAWAARDLALVTRHAGGLGEATELLGLVAHSRGRWRDRVRYEITDTAQRPEDVAGSVFDAHLCLAEYLLYGQQPYDEVIEFAADLRAAAARSGAGRGEAFATCLLGEAQLLSGRLDEAEDHLERSARLHEAVAASAGQGLSLQRLAEAALAAGDAPRATALLEEAERVSQGSTLERHLVGKVYGTMVRAQPDPRAAMRAVERAEARMAGQPLCESCAIGFFVAAAIAAARAGEPVAAREYLGRAEHVSQEWPGGGWHAAVLEARAAVADAEGDADAAVRLLAQAAAGFEGAGQPLDAHRCRLQAAARAPMPNGAEAARTA
jgi:DNA-binding SARP family transcriptional activator/tetratricopeptide (TPR) repeat protein